MGAKIRILDSRLKVTELKSNMKEIKSEKKEEEVSELEQEVSGESATDAMPAGDLNPTLRANLASIAQNSQADANQDNNRRDRDSNTRDRNESESNVNYSNQAEHSNIEAKYQVNTLESQRTQNASVMQHSETQHSSRFRFDNPDLLALQNRHQEGGEQYEGRMATSDVHVKRRREWER